MKQRRRVAALPVAALFALPAGADAATVRAVYAKEAPSVPAELVLRFDAARGEANRVSVGPRAGDPAAVEVRDPSAVVRPGNGCAAIDEHDVACTPALFRGARAELPTRYMRVLVSLGDGADEADNRLGEGRPVTLRGGDGADRLRGEDAAVDVLEGDGGPDRLTGRGGDDYLTGGGGGDAVSGGAGDDFLTDEGRGDGRSRDSFAGGPGRDRLVYGARPGRVVVDLLRRRGAEGDRLSGIEDAQGGAGRDRLRGDRRPNRLYGGGGGDELESRAGGDTLIGGDGGDRMLGGSGHDLLEAEDPGRDRRDRALCGSGHDTVRFPRVADRLNTDCERAVVAEPDGVWEVAVALPLRPTRRGVVELRLSDTRGGDPFAGRVTIRFGGLFLGRPSAVVRLRQGGRATARVRLVTPALARLRDSRRLSVVVGLGGATFTTLLRSYTRERAPARRGPGGGTPA